MLLTPNWREWYHFRHQQSCFQSGTLFEQYVTDILSRFHDDFVNPAPAGSLGDGGCDGLAESGSVLYACYGQRPMRNAERELRDKLESDFARGVSSWGTFTKWRFVTNAPIGPETLKALTALQKDHGPDSARPLTIRAWQSEKLWSEVVCQLSTGDLDALFPGAPGVGNVELRDLIPLLDSLGNDDPDGYITGRIFPVPIDKMEYNALPAASQMEFNAGRIMAPRIDRWYSEASDPALRDSHGQRFKAIYDDAQVHASDAAEILERLYVAVAGPNFRMYGKRANAAFAVVSYFFDTCRIFKVPPPGVGDQVATAN